VLKVILTDINISNSVQNN